MLNSVDRTDTKTQKEQLISLKYNIHTKGRQEAKGVNVLAISIIFDIVLKLFNNVKNKLYSALCTLCKIVLNQIV